MDSVKAYADAAVAGVPLVLVVLALVEYFKAMGATGKVLLVISMLIGLAFGGCYMVAQAIPVDFAGWFAVAVYGIGMGLIASGLFNVVKGLLAKAMETARGQG